MQIIEIAKIFSYFKSKNSYMELSVNFLFLIEKRGLSVDNQSDSFGDVYNES